MNKHLSRIIGALLLLSFISPAAFAQDMPQPPEGMPPEPPPGVTDQQQPQQPAQTYTQQQLDQMLAPIALYPDPLIAQVLMASTYPLEVVEAYRWRQDPANAQLQGDQLASALEQQPWDPSVKSVVAVPQILKTLNDNLQWTEQLGDAFIAQQPAVMDSVQRLRQRAESAGSLNSTPQQVVSTQGPDIVIQQANPQVVYVPVYNPTVVYGAWPYVGYPPYYFSGYAYGGLGIAIGFGVGIAVVDTLWGWNHWDWGSHRILIDDRRFAVLNRGHGPIGGGVWEHAPDHRRGVPYRDAATRARFQGSITPETQRNFRGFGSNATPPARVNNEATVRNTSATRTNFNANRASTPQATPAIMHNTTQATTQQRSASFAQHAATPQAQQQRSVPMFESFSRGSDVRNQSTRGAFSRASTPAAMPRMQQQNVQRSAPQQHSAPAAGGSGRSNNDNDRHR